MIVAPIYTIPTTVGTIPCMSALADSKGVGSGEELNPNFGPCCLGTYSYPSLVGGSTSC